MVKLQDASPNVETPPADVASDLSLHQRILGDIEDRILSGEWQPGFRIPFEVDLAEQYKCSRMTVNKALTQLAKTGLIERRRKSGSYVTQPRAQSAVLEIRDIKLEVQSLGLAYDYKLSAKTRRRSNAEDRSQARPRRGSTHSGCDLHAFCRQSGRFASNSA